MEATAAKRARVGGASAPDRLSALSDKLLCHVLSFLRSRQAVQTTILSKRDITLDTMDFPENGSCYYINWEKMKDFTTNLLMLHSTQFLDAIRLRLGISPCPILPDVERWVRYLIKHHPLVLEINSGTHFRYRFQIPLVGSAFRRLQMLKLHGVYVDHGFTERLNSGCPVLEDLVLDDCRNCFVSIQSDTLKNLVVHCCSNNGTTEVLVIRAPCLISVSLKFPYGYYRNGISLQAGNSLAKASISIGHEQLSQSVQTILLGGLCNVTSLELQGFSAQAFLDKELDFTTFDNLRTLSLNWYSLISHDACKFTALGRFLQKSPNLEKLNLQDFRVKPFVGPIEFPMLENLRTLFLDRCDLGDNFRILCHFLQRYPNLEKLTVRCCELPEGANGGKGKANSGKTHFRFQNLVGIQCRKLKSADIIYKKGDKIQELVSFLLDISEDAPMNTVTLTKV